MSVVGVPGEGAETMLDDAGQDDIIVMTRHQRVYQRCVKMPLEAAKRRLQMQS